MQAVAALQAEADRLQSENSQLRKQNAALRGGDGGAGMGDLSAELERTTAAVLQACAGLDRAYGAMSGRVAGMEAAAAAARGEQHRAIAAGEHAVAATRDKALAAIHEANEQETRQLYEFRAEMARLLEQVQGETARKCGELERLIRSQREDSARVLDGAMRRALGQVTEGHALARAVAEGHATMGAEPEFSVVREEAARFAMSDVGGVGGVAAALGALRREEQRQLREGTEVMLRRFAATLDAAAAQVGRQVGAGGAPPTGPEQDHMVAEWREQAEAQLQRLLSHMRAVADRVAETPLDAELAPVEELLRQARWSGLLQKGDGSIWDELLELCGGEQPDADRNIAWLVHNHPDPQPVPSATVCATVIAPTIFAAFVVQLARGLSLDDAVSARLKYIFTVCTALSPKWDRSPQLDAEAHPFPDSLSAGYEMVDMLRMAKKEMDTRRDAIGQHPDFQKAHTTLMGIISQWVETQR